MPAWLLVLRARRKMNWAPAGMAPRAMLIGAGGIRDEADLRLAAQAGAAAWLTASALHDRRLAPRAN